MIKIKIYGVETLTRKIESRQKFINKAIQKTLKQMRGEQLLWCRFLLSIQSIWYRILKR